MLKFKCTDVGFDCGWTAKGKTEDEILAQCAAHAIKYHNMKPEEITEELKVRSNQTSTSTGFDQLLTS